MGSYAQTIGSTLLRISTVQRGCPFLYMDFFADVRHYFDEGGNMQENDKFSQQENQRPLISPSKKKGWYKTWWGILLMIFVIAPVLFITLIVGYAVNSPHQQSYDAQNTPKNQQVRQEEQDNLAQKERQAVIDTYSEPYCSNHTNVLMKNDPVLTKDNWPTFDGRRNWTSDECRTIITMLYDSGTSKERIANISEGRKIGVGMTNAEVIYSMGYPNDINTTNNSSGTYEQWVYGDPIYGATYVYVDNGIVTSYQQ